MENRKVFDRRQVKLENLMKSDYIPLGAGRPSRATVIGADDVRNLLIALNTAKSLDEFLTKV